MPENRFTSPRQPPPSMGAKRLPKLMPGRLVQESARCCRSRGRGSTAPRANTVEGSTAPGVAGTTGPEQQGRLLCRLACTSSKTTTSGSSHQADPGRRVPQHAFCNTLVRVNEVVAPVSCIVEPAQLVLVGTGATIRHMKRFWGAVSRPGPMQVVAGIAGVLVVLYLVLVAAPPWFVQNRTLEGLKAQNEVRTTLLQGLAGVVLALGAYFTYRQVMLSRTQVQILQQGQITERFTRAIDQLGHAQLDVRLGGIYALERIVRDSPADRATIGEVLTAFVRTHSPWLPQLDDQPAARAPI